MQINHSSHCVSICLNTHIFSFTIIHNLHKCIICLRIQAGTHSKLVNPTSFLTDTLEHVLRRTLIGIFRHFPVAFSSPRERDNPKLLYLVTVASKNIRILLGCVVNLDIYDTPLIVVITLGGRVDFYLLTTNSLLCRATSIDVFYNKHI